MRIVSIDLKFLSRAYFTFDKPVPYKLANGELFITPVLLESSENFLACFDVIGFDKNSYPDPKVIQMSYLQFIRDILIKGDKELGSIYSAKLKILLEICLGLKKPEIITVDNRRFSIRDKEAGVIISSKQFDEIREIILHQNFPHYDDSYINPDLKQAMLEVDETKNKDIISPSLERKMAIITAHCGISKREQQAMTYRSHALLFEEVVGEVEYTTTRPIALYAGKASEMDHWIYKKQKDKFAGYVQSVDSYTKSMGGAQSIKSSDTSLGDSYAQKYNDFKK